MKSNIVRYLHTHTHTPNDHDCHYETAHTHTNDNTNGKFTAHAKLNGSPLLSLLSPLSLSNISFFSLPLSDFLFSLSFFSLVSLRMFELSSINYQIFQFTFSWNMCHLTLFGRQNDIRLGRTWYQLHLKWLFLQRFAWEVLFCDWIKYEAILVKCASRNNWKWKVAAMVCNHGSLV